MAKRVFISILLILGILYWIGNAISFNEDFAHITFDIEGQIIAASVSDDQQWRIQSTEAVPDKLAIAIQRFEDDYFYYHPGINPISLSKAMLSNYKAQKIVRGGSTLTMQLARIVQGNRPRTYLQKLKEMIIAVALEVRYSKKEILAFYAQHAPFGGNIVGYTSASWKYYGKNPSLLSWSEAAALAVLPNAPSDIFPGQNQQAFKRKRDFLLNKLFNKNHIDATSLRLALMETLPGEIFYFDQSAPHLHQKMIVENKNNVITSIDGALQKNVIKTLQSYGEKYKGNGIFNGAAVVIDNHTGGILSYVGNVDSSPAQLRKDVDIIQSFRSPGSTLKPFLYASAMDRGLITATSLLEDVPSFYNGFTPQNYDKKFRGIVAANNALTQSLNIPAVNLLREMGVQPFIEVLNQMGFDHTDQDDDHYGLSLILGGNEVSPLELGRAYMNLARAASAKDPIEMNFVNDGKEKPRSSPYSISIANAYNMINILTEVHRPQLRDGWQFFESKKNVAWKTGTSYGNRDAWAAATTMDHTIIVWIGNATGEGRPGLTGLGMAAPVLFDIIDYLPPGEWFEPPIAHIEMIEVCSKSGYRKGLHCDHGEWIDAPKHLRGLPSCPFHSPYVMDYSQTYLINSACQDPSSGVAKNLFVLDSKVDYYYKLATGNSHALPPLHPDCAQNPQNISILYPEKAAQILLPRDIDSEEQKLICRATSHMTSDTLFWFLDDQYVKSTIGDHAVQLDQLEEGVHDLAVSSTTGAMAKSQFEIVKE